MDNENRQQPMPSGDGSYVVKKNKKLNILVFILCVLASFCIWVYVMNAQNNNYTKTFSVAIEVINEDELLDSTGLSVFGIPEIPASVTIQGNKADVQKFTEKDFRAYIDLSAIKEAGNATLSVSIEMPSAAVSVLESSPKTVSVYADNLVTSEVELKTAYAEENSPYTFSCERKTIMVSGPKSYIDTIEHAEVVVPVSDDYTAGQIVASSDIRLYKGKTLQSSLYMVFDVESINVKVTSVNE